jgi:hypothetical protein
MSARVAEDEGTELSGLGDEGGKGGRDRDLESDLEGMLADRHESSGAEDGGEGDGDEVSNTSRGRAKRREMEKQESLSRSSEEEEELTDDSDDNGSRGPVLLTLPL